MKIRSGFVSNSSSSSFILDKRYMTPEQIKKVLEYKGSDGWEIYQDDDFVRGNTIMDNEEIQDFFKEIDLQYKAIVSYGGDG